MEDRLNVKDLINIGLFTAMYFITMLVPGVLVLIPIFAVLLPFILAVIGGIPFMLYLTKVNKFGMISITGVIMALLKFAMGHGWPILPIGIFLAVIADLILKSGGYRKWPVIVAGYAVFSLWTFGLLLPMWIMRDAYFAKIREAYGAEYTNALMSIMSGWTLAIPPVLTVVGAMGGAFLGRAVMKKHFQRAGIA